MRRPGRPETEIAIVGIGCRLPGGVAGPDDLWRLLADGVDAITEVPPGRFDVDAVFDPDPGAAGKLYTRWGGFVEGIDRFDADFFGISPREARRMDPQQRLLLEVTWNALEDAGQPVDRLAGSSTAVFVGISSHDYAHIQARPDVRHAIDAHVNAGGAASIAANRISYVLDLRGPSLVVDTACSSSLTAVHLACRSLREGECTLAVVGAANALLTPEPTVGFCRAAMLSPTGRCKPFDARADGYVRSEGAAAVVLKPLARALADGDAVYAVIRGTAINQDGRTPGLAVPSAAAQEALLDRALREAGVSPASVQYVEAHGTGTPVGDPREARAIGAVVSARRRPEQPCLLGSVKSNVGHLEAAAGVVGLIKTALALERRRIPPTLHFSEPSPEIPFEELRLRVPTTLEPWPDHERQAVAGVNSFGFGGANAHVVLAEAPTPRPAAATGGGADILVLSARSPGALRDVARSYAARLRDPDAPRLLDVCYTAALRRAHHEHRLAAVGDTNEDVARRLEAFLAGERDSAVSAGRAARGGRPRVAFVFSGMGPQRPGMGRRLLDEEPVFRQAVEDVDRALMPLAGWSVLGELGGEGGEAAELSIEVAQVANLALQVGLMELWRSWGIVPDAVVGHSAGEVAAAWAAGALTLPDAVLLAFHRGRLLQGVGGTGGMLAAGISPRAARELLDGRPGVSLAAVNGPSSVTFSGRLDTLAEIAAAVEQAGRFHRMLAVSVPYHSPEMDGLREELTAALADLEPRAPEIPIVSTTTAQWHDGRPFDAAHWWRNMRRPVLFAGAVERLLADGFDTFVEVSAHPVLAHSIAECQEGSGWEAVILPTLRRSEGDRASMLRSLAELFVRGRPVRWPEVAASGGRCVRLPAYPWERERHWFEAPPAHPPGEGTRYPLLGRRLRAARPTWEADLGDPRLSFLAGHAVDGRATFPGSGFVETALAAAATLRGGPPVALEELQLERLLALPAEGGVTLQCAVEEREGSLEIHSAAGASLSWTLRAAGRLAEPFPAEPGDVDLEEIRERCAAAASAEAFYESLEALHGLRYDGAFRAVDGLWRGRGEAFGRIAPAADLVLDDYHVHPALLDAAFQVFTAAAADALDGAGGPVLPVSAARIELHARVVGSVWSHATVSRHDGSVLEGDVRLIDESGRLVMSCRGLRAKVVGEGEPESPDDWLYEERWEPERRHHETAIPPVADLAASAQLALDAVAEENRVAEFYTTFEPALDRLARGYVVDALRELGFEPDRDGRAEPDVLAERLGVAARQRRFFARLLELGGPGDAPADGRKPDASPLADTPYASALSLVRASGERLARTLRGEDDPREWLFAGEALEALAALYARNPGFRSYGAAVAEAVARAQEAIAPQPVRVLEVGAGTGGTTAVLLPRLASGAYEYRFTDVSSFFVRQAAERFRDDPNLSAETLDIEQPPPETQAFDVVVAADVVHATADVRATLENLRGCLVPGGLLVLVEGIRECFWLELVFGQLAGWWRFRDHELRPTHPLLGARQWERVLAEIGFAGATAITEASPAASEPVHALVLATAPPAVGEAPPRPPRRWLVLTDRQGVGPELAAALRERGDDCVLVWPGDEYATFGADGVQLVPASPGDWARLLEEHGDVDGVLHLWSLDAPADADAGELMAFQRLSCGSVVGLVQGSRAAARPLPDVWLVTAGAQAVPGADAAAGPGQAPVWGLGRVLRNEHGGSDCRLVDLDSTPAFEDVEALVAELAGDGAEPAAELAFRAGRRYARRLARASLPPDAPPESSVALSPSKASFRAEVDVPGALETLVLREAPDAGPGPGEIAVRVAASGLNFRDVLVALGMPFALAFGGADDGALGWECAGVVEACGDGVADLRPGDEVMAIAAGAFGSRVVTTLDCVAPMPDRLTFEEAATVPAAFVTAEYALAELARLRRGERVLVHSAAGGVGLAAVQIAQRAGAEVFATAGTEEKRDYLRSLGVVHVMDSRSVAFADEVRERTSGQGVDVVLNSLAGEALVKGIELLRPYGRFLELGKRDFHENTRLGLGLLQRNISFFGVDVQALAHERPAVLGSLLRSLARRLQDGELEPLPHRVFDLAELEPAMRHMAQARHIGKVVVSVAKPSYPVLRRAAEPLFHSDATYLIAGGLGGFGLAVAGWMAREGAGAIVLTSRSGVPREDDEPALEDLRSSGADVVVAQADVSDRADVDRLLTRIRATKPPLAGVVHAAMVLEDAPLETIDYPRFERVLAPKLAGAWNLHELTRDDPLDFFVLFSSLAALVGPPSQGSYAAANAFLGALAAHRRAHGRPAVAIDWGWVADVGYVARRPELARRLARTGLRSIPVADACSALRRAIRGEAPRVAVARMGRAWTWDDLASRQSRESNRPTARSQAPSRSGGEGDGLAAEIAAAPPEERTAILGTHLVRRTARILDTSPERIDPDRPLPDMGLDSLMAVELRTAVRSDFGVEVPIVDLLEALTLRGLASAVLERLEGDGGG